MACVRSVGPPSGFTAQRKQAKRHVTDGPGIKEALGFLMTRELAHQKSFEKAMHAIQPNFPQGKCPVCPSSPASTPRYSPSHAERC